MERTDKLALAGFVVLLLVAGVIGALLIRQKQQASKIEIIDGVVYGPVTGKVTVALQIRNAENQSQERMVNLNLALPAFSGVLEAHGRRWQADGSCRPMVSTQTPYMAEFQFRPEGSQGEGLKWKSPAELDKRYEMGKLEDLTFFITLHPPPE